MDKLDTRKIPDEERRLSELFDALAPPLEDQGFSVRVARRIRRRRWLRRAVLGAAVVVGGMLSLDPLVEVSVLVYEFSVQLSEGLISSATSWNDPAWLAQNRLVLILAILAASLPGAIRLSGE